MARFVDGPVRVRVPASSANLGPGFDALGIALDLHDELEAEVLAEGLEIEVSGAGSDDVPRDESHLVLRAMRRAFSVLGAEPPGLRLRCDNVIPHSRGLGSSSAAIVAGLGLARALVRGGTLVMDDDALFRLAAEIEGHPDNVAPAVYGGFVISGAEDGAWFAARSTVDPRVSVVVFVPPEPVSTEVARGLLPEQVPHARAAANGGRTALLVAALAGQPELLHTATRDFLHQDYREPAMPRSLALVRSLRAEGQAAVVSGAGPTVLAFADSSTAEQLTDRCPEGWLTRHLAIDRVGCHTL
jgi:homoserine kinase